MQHQETLLRVALLGNSRKCNSFSAKRVISSSNLAGRQPKKAQLTLAPIDSFFWKLQAEQLAELHERLRSAEKKRRWRGWGASQLSPLSGVCGCVCMCVCVRTSAGVCVRVYMCLCLFGRVAGSARDKSWVVVAAVSEFLTAVLIFCSPWDQGLRAQGRGVPRPRGAL